MKHSPSSSTDTIPPSRAELMRLLVDDHQIEWEKAWHVTQSTSAIPIIPSSAGPREMVPPLVQKPSARHLEIIYGSNRPLSGRAAREIPGDDQRCQPHVPDRREGVSDPSGWPPGLRGQPCDQRVAELHSRAAGSGMSPGLLRMDRRSSPT